MEIKYVDLFTGIGGFRYAFEKACKKMKKNCTCVGFSEIDKYAIKTYESNFKKNKNEEALGDITKINVKKMSDFDALFAGFPCQPFSLMGKKKGFADTRGTMFFYIENMIKEKQPKFFVLENVRGLLTHDNGKTHASIIKILEKKLGYSTKTWMLNSSDYGIPQTRRRMYIIGFKNKDIIKNIDVPKKVKNSRIPSTWHLLDKKVDDKYYVSEKTLKIILANGSGNFYSKSKINMIIARPLTATMHKMHRACQDNYFSDKYILGLYDKKNNKVKLNNKVKNKIRRLTPTEAFRLQGFPDSFVKNAQKDGVSDTQLYRQAGNSITVNTLEKVFLEILANYN